MQFSARVHVLKPLPLFGRLPFESHARMTEYFSSARQIRFRGSEYHDGEFISVRIVEPKLSPAPSRQLWEERVEYDLLFETSLQFPGAKAITARSSDGLESPKSPSEKRHLWSKHIAPRSLKLCVNTYLLSLEFSYPSISFGASEYRAGRTLLFHDKTLFSTLAESLKYLQGNNIDPVVDLTPDTVWKWMSTKNGVFSGFSDTPASRSLSYFTRLYNTSFRNDELSDLVWALASIEALLVDSGRSSVGQLTAKLGCLFSGHNSRQFMVDQIEKTYGFRSKMIHGNRQVLSVFRRDELEPDKRFSEEYDSIRYAVGIAFILIQRLIRDNGKNFSFRLVLDQ
ncbi:hypothetical protein [Nitratireductor sp. GCM10026969]|uniref:hypothetical protein n=1 Tax=Nitratireductor sp. GCM10026969 TaxID=3252645 RepID=UPI00361FBA12